MHKDLKNPIHRVKQDSAFSIQSSVQSSKVLKLGQVNFINCLPINLPIETHEISLNAQIINGVPSELNKMILSEEIDLAPVSSLTYLENKDILLPLASLCIASDGPADSVLLFSHFPIQELDGSKVALSPASGTSNKLLQIIFKEFYKMNIRAEIRNLSFSDFPKEYSAALFIGDQALREFSKMPKDIFTYDLGSLWKEYTDLPMVFGLWVVRKDLFQNYKDDVKDLEIKLNQAKEQGLGSLFETVIEKAQDKIFISKEFYINYFHNLSYDFTEKCKIGLKLFEEYNKKFDKSMIKT